MGFTLKGLSVCKWGTFHMHPGLQQRAGGVIPRGRVYRAFCHSSAMTRWSCSQGHDDTQSHRCFIESLTQTGYGKLSFSFTSEDFPHVHVCVCVGGYSTKPKVSLKFFLIWNIYIYIYSKGGLNKLHK